MSYFRVIGVRSGGDGDGEPVAFDIESSHPPADGEAITVLSGEDEESAVVVSGTARVFFVERLAALKGG